MSAAYANRAGCPAPIELIEILALFNAARASEGLPPKERHWARRICEARGIRFTQVGPRCKLSTTVAELRRAGIWGALEQHQARFDEEGLDDADAA